MSTWMSSTWCYEYALAMETGINLCGNGVSHEATWLQFCKKSIKCYHATVFTTTKSHIDMCQNFNFWMKKQSFVCTVLFICTTCTRGRYWWDKVQRPMWTMRPLRDHFWIFGGTCKPSWCKVPSGIIFFNLNPVQHHFSLWRLWEPGC